MYSIRCSEQAYSHLSTVSAKVVVWSRALIRSVNEDGLNYRASSLAYRSLLSLIPGLAIIFSLLKIFGQEEYLKPFLIHIFEPLGVEAPILISKLMDFVGGVNVGVLGFVGLISLLYMIVSMFMEIESAFNHIWRIKKKVNLGMRAGEYLSITLLGPVFVFSAAGLSSYIPGNSAIHELLGREPYNTLLNLGDKLYSVFLVIVVFSFIYVYTLKPLVLWKAALFGGVIGGIAWKITGYWFSVFITMSANYHAIYSNLLMIILFMMWLQLSWLMLLLGGQSAMFFQYPYRLGGGYQPLNPCGHAKEWLGLAIMVLVARAFINKDRPLTLDALEKSMSLPKELLEETLDILQQNGLLVETAGSDAGYLPVRDIAGITILEIVRSMRMDRDSAVLINKHGVMPPMVANVIDIFDEAAAKTAVASLSLREMVTRNSIDVN
ncbi:YihY family inner membrane protein [Candidatus Methylospira mobilis]|uniref:YihY family inner membrane protein n=1 Tax=Candidatus Methylospira mobilis TaxID=1808979 RepID=A0A5Q0BI65_9GAMM|nr:YhjD/YihY/BrkB family envelope integrity protein [Candidatus Methylospira mobilis]QFY43513.1 YihY family inner membrane protein [Candidatus Methylospira mobilis]WNV03945.1 YhjD/YihY/BrkB family envelope integrity protein [Candidatus Methylospira mobilis]